MAPSLQNLHVAHRQNSRSITLGVGGVWGSLGFHGVVAGGTVNAADTPGLDNLKSFRDAIHQYFPRIFIRCRKLGFAGLSAIGTPKLLNPTITGHPVICFPQRPCSSPEVCHNQTGLPPVWVPACFDPVFTAQEIGQEFHHGYLPAARRRMPASVSPSTPSRLTA